MSGYVKNHIMYDYFCILKHHIRYCSVVNAKYHIQYDFIRVIQLSYRLPVFRRADPISGCSGSAGTAPARSGPASQDVAVFSADCDPICCVPPLPRDRPLTTLKGRFAYSLTVVHFRKVVICQKIGSHRNGHPVIYIWVYMSAYYHPANDDVMGKSSG